LELFISFFSLAAPAAHASTDLSCGSVSHHHEVYPQYLWNTAAGGDVERSRKRPGRKAGAVRFHSSFTPQIQREREFGPFPILNPTFLSGKQRSPNRIWFVCDHRQEGSSGAAGNSSPMLPMFQGPFAQTE